MRKSLLEFQNLKKKSKNVLYIFFLVIAFIVLSFLYTLIAIDYSKGLSMISLLSSVLCMLLCVFFLMRNRNIIERAEELLLNSISDSTINKVEVFQKLMDDNLFCYHYQPIIDAKNGEIFAYEALMRTSPNTINLQPLEILDLAVKNNRLYELEKYTFQNNLKLMKENYELFQNKKLFINSISGSQLNEDDFITLYAGFGTLYQHIVVEIVDTSNINDDNVKLIVNRMNETHLQLALDNYGTRYCSEATLISFNPNYIKIDGSYLRYMHVDPKKQNVITSLISFASQNNIKIIAEGIETKDELDAAISLGVDYIQGFYTAKPAPEMIKRLPKEITEQILEINKREFGAYHTKKLYEAKGVTLISPVALALEMYSDILILEEEVCLQGNQELLANMSIIIPDHHNCRLTLDHINLRGNEKPTLLLGKNCSVLLNLIGDNYICFDGIRVPESSVLTINGDGNLYITAEQSNRIGIGGNAQQSYGNITLAMKGTLKLKTSGNKSIGIGGGQNPNNSQIRIISGTINIESSGYKSIGIGSISGNARVSIDGGELSLLSEGTKAVGIGSMSGYVDIESSARLTIKCNGKKAVGIGSLEDSDGKVIIRDGSVDIKLSAYLGSAIGAMGGKLNITILNGDIEINVNGSDVVGLGDHSGIGEIRIQDGIVSIQLFSIHAVPIGNINRKVIIDGGNIQCDFPEDIIPVNSFDTPLVSRIILDTNEYNQAVDTVNYTYQYHASYSERYPYIKVYLPETISF